MASSVGKGAAMSGDLLQRAKAALPIRAIWRKLNLPGDPPERDGAKFCSPLRPDEHPNCTIKDDRIHDWARNERLDSFDVFQHVRGLNSKQAFPEFVNLAGLGHELNKNGQNQQGPRSKQQINWQTCVDAVSPLDLNQLSEWRVYSLEFCRWLITQQLIGRYNELWAFPVMHGGKVVSAHVRLGKNEWFFEPRLKEIGVPLSPLVIGNPADASKVFISESQWDVFAVLDRLGINYGEEVVGISTRSAGNGRLLKEVIGEIYLIPQNDQPGQKWLKDAQATLGRPVKIITVPKCHHDANDWLRAATADDLLAAMKTATVVEPTATQEGDAVESDGPPFAQKLERDFASESTPEEPKVYIEFLKPSEIKAYQPAEGHVMVGNNHIVRGSVFVIAGPPGVGKSRSIVALGEAGATQYEWFGQKVHCKFKTLIVQNENGRYRLKLELAKLDDRALDDYMRITPPPAYGLCFSKAEFRDQLKEQIDSFQPDVIAIDPWNAVARDDKAKDYIESFDLIRSVVPAGDDAPAIGIAAHTRKPAQGERASGRTLLNLLAGSYVLTSVPRSVWVLQHASDDVHENRVVVTCCKNNDGELGPRSVWLRDNGLWSQVYDFDWEAWENPDASIKEKGITETALAEVFDNGRLQLSSSDAVKALMNLTGCKKSACYNSLDHKGRFRDHLRYNPRTKIFA